MMKYIIDRFEEDYAVIETEEGKTFDLPKDMIPKDAREGDVLDIEVKVNKEDTRKREKEIKDLMDELWN
ncbi:DUF3006 domain-containing protein [Hathewaya massiliensis]|uniref:DUF3006 domain-containing protein n=1 Tax=Hathewaya massiliensis TaxID=1964382 RepID=UPI001FAABC54|nr:DUF3006 domain-containing protein [Hathewaya massiliensis]